MSQKLDVLERTVLELGTELYRFKHRIDVFEKENQYFRDLFVSLRGLLDEKGFVSKEDFDEAVAIDKILAKQANSLQDLPLAMPEDLKKAIN
jgi:hypothetical protein